MSNTQQDQQKAEQRGEQDPGNHSMVTLKVGESCYRSSPATLLKAGLFRELLQEGGENQEYSLDRDGALFGYILKFLRTGAIAFPDGFGQREELRREAAFYQLEKLEQALDAGAGEVQMITLTHKDNDSDTDTDDNNEEIFHVMPVGWSWGDLENLLPPVKDLTVCKANISLRRSNCEFNFSFQGGGSLRNPTPHDYVSQCVRSMPSGGLQIQAVDQARKMSLLGRLMADHGFKMEAASTSDSDSESESSVVEEINLYRIKPVVAAET